MKLTALDVPPQVTVREAVHPLGGGVLTVTCSVPTAAVSEAEMGADSPFKGTNVVILGEPFH